MNLLELVIALSLSVTMLSLVDKIYSYLWQTHHWITQAQASLNVRRIPEQLFSRVLFEAGDLGCRAVREGIEISAPSTLPTAFWIQTGQAIAIQGQELWIHETDRKRQPKWGDWVIISDCQRADLHQYTGQALEPGKQIFPVVISRWFLKEETVMREQHYPFEKAQPVVDGVKNWHWRREGALLFLTWETAEHVDQHLFQLGNS